MVVEIIKVVYLFHVDNVDAMIPSKLCDLIDSVTNSIEILDYVKAKGSEEIGFTIISLTFSLIAVLIPLLFMRDVVGRLFREFAITLAVAILISAVVSLTLVPMMSARWLKPHDAQAQPRGFGAAVQRFFDRVVAHYDRGLQQVLAHQGLTLLVALALGTSVSEQLPRNPGSSVLVQGILASGLVFLVSSTLSLVPAGAEAERALSDIGFQAFLGGVLGIPLVAALSALLDFNSGRAPG